MNIKKFRGQSVKIEDNIYEIEIRKPHIRSGEKVKIGLSDKLVQVAGQAKAKIRVLIPDRFVDFTVFPWEVMDYGEKKEMPSKFGTPWFVWLYTVPDVEWRKAERREAQG